MKVFELMKAHVVKTTPEATLRDAVDKMDLYQVSGLPVVNARDELVGVVSEYDVIQALLPEYVRLGEGAGSRPQEDLATLVARVREMPVGQAMSSPAVSVDENTDVLDAAAIMLERRFKRLPVTSEGRLVGVISRIDICQAVLEGQV